MNGSERVPEQSPETGAIPYNIGYDTPHAVTEFGVMEDRRSKGLGFYLVETTENREYADKLVGEAGDYPRFLRGRAVLYHPWRDLATQPEQDPAS